MGLESRRHRRPTHRLGPRHGRGAKSPADPLFPQPPSLVAGARPIPPEADALHQLELALIFSPVEAASRLGDQPIRADGPYLISADVNAPPGPARPSVGADERPRSEERRVGKE